jgi:beta-glucosidase-like glycosyl hydrolase
LVLVKNDNSALPLSPGSTVAVVGPLALAQEALMGDYYADAVCPGAMPPNRGTFDCVPTLASAFTAANAGWVPAVLALFS